ncbi:uncharacterized protein TRIADDRAFT_60195 [Trichoplax adhaerens]|uniref:phosphatidylinositol-3,4,5-trisphosphate 5-phosphatase n=1 Tax=Trichoplax adhaerens TaxID=10228 RepID=B3S7K1_TRIAD|nr:hypothetical protein TRIADDRAFT_60195 [Trichoplax adhaerens]EDV21305.1 hypothetical protein TRIADDRAFT_60195 [Trichoplax adhaerens]|eukprot:XP_002116272.1 hypothetical protein TRIADDRAFT_60195 [Trichoplax adhaerens]
MENLANYYIDVSYEQAEDLLRLEDQDGAFLIRPSHRVPGTFALSIRYRNKFFHHRIKVFHGRFVCEGFTEKTFSSMDELVKHFRQPNQGLAHPLTKSVSPPTPTEEDESNYENSLKTLLKEIANRSIPSLGYSNEHTKLMQTYFEKEVLDDLNDIKTNNSGRCTKFEKLLALLSKQLNSEIDHFNGYLDTMAQITTRIAQPAPDSLDFLYRIRPDNDDSPMELTVDAVVNKLSSCRQLLQNVNDQFFKLLKADVDADNPSSSGSNSGDSAMITDHTSSNESDDIHPARTSDDDHDPATRQSPDADEPREVRLPNRSYKVIVLSEKRKTTEAAIKIDFSKRQLEILLSSEEGTVISKTLPSEIYRVIKDPEDFQKLKLIFGKGKFSRQHIFRFPDARSAQQFFSGVESLKDPDTSKHSDKINIFVGTWNMGGKRPPDDIQSWPLCHGQGIKLNKKADIAFDIYAFGTQVQVNSLWGIRIVILCRPEVAFRITDVKSAQVRTGAGGTLGNKGGVAVSFRLDDTNFCFINSHLAARVEEKKRRQDNVQAIARNLCLGDLNPNITDVTHQFHHIFWFGDLNYRLEMAVPEANNGISCRNFAKLFQVDQLHQEKLNGSVFTDWRERELNFPPTYRLVVGKDDAYDCFKRRPGGRNAINTPSWCDRILWKSYPSLAMECISYGSVHDILTSDHLPVFGLYQTDVNSNRLVDIMKKLNYNPHKMPAYIAILNAHAAIRSVKRYVAHFTLEFVSSCLEDPVESAPNTSGWQINSITSQIPHSSIPSNQIHLCPLWESSDLPNRMKAKYPFDEYLERQSLLVSLKTSDNGEYLGACHVPLTTFMTHESKSYVASLTLYGEEIGKLEISGYITR